MGHPWRWSSRWDGVVVRDMGRHEGYQGQLSPSLVGEMHAREAWQGSDKWCTSPATFKSIPTALLSPSAPQSTVQSYLEGVSAGLEQLRAAVQEVQSVCQELGAARWALLDCADRFQDLQQMRALMAEHVQLASVVQVLPQLFSGKALAQRSWVWGSDPSPCDLPVTPCPWSQHQLPVAPCTQPWHLLSLSRSPRGFFPHAAAAPRAAPPGGPRGDHDAGAPPG